MLKTIAKSIGKVVISLLIPFKVLAKGVYHALKAVFIPLYHLFKSMILGIIKGVKWLSIGIYRVLIYPIYLVFKKLSEWGYLMAKAIVLFFYNYLLIPVSKGLKTITLWSYEVVKWLSIGFYKVFIKPIYWVLKKIYQGLSWVLSKFSHYLYLYILKPMYKILKWLIKGFVKQVEKLIDILIQIYHWMVLLGRMLWRFIKPILKFIYGGFIFILKGIRFVLRKIGKLLKWLYEGLEYLISKPIDFIIWIFKKCFQGTRYLIDALVRLYRKMPESLYLGLKVMVIYTALGIHFIFWMIPKTLLYTVPKWIFTKLWIVLRHLVFKLFELILEGFVLLSNSLTKLRYALYPLSRIIKDLVHDFKDYYYILLLLPILLPVFILFLGGVLIEVLFIHLGLTLKALFTKPNTFIKLPYLPSINLFKEADLYIRKVKLSLGYNQKWRNAHGLMVTILWPLCFIIRWIIAIILLPITILTGLFYLLRYGMNRDYLTSNIADFLTIKTEYPGIIEGKPLILFGHKVTINVSDAYYDSELFVYVVSNTCSNTHLTIEIDGVAAHSQSIRIQGNPKTELLYAFLNLEVEIQKDKLPRIELPILEGFTVIYQKTHQADILYDNVLTIRDYSNKTDLTVKIQLSERRYYERTFEVVKINTQRLDVLFFQDYYQIYQNQTVLSLLDPKLKYTFLENPYLNNTKVCSKEPQFEVQFKVLGLDHIYTLPLKTINNPISGLLVKNTIQKPNYDVQTKRFKLQTQSVVNRFVVDIKWTIDNQKVESDVSLESLEIIPYHRFVGSYTQDFNTYSETFIIKDHRYEAYTYEFERKHLEEALNTNSAFALTHIVLPTFQLKPIWACFFISKDPSIIKSTGYIQSSGVSTFEVILYKHLFKFKKVWIQIKQ
ncbi:hypothetical protein N7603_02960 [Acholeplasma vituli]|uniref:Uncharacterized protein n=1 Tax=Paracholeplasma vituli TaxID=69473 RepID=A0ABT2PW15_9MOLU|nr:hypothetical protein [Paracholeplasma vituli]MCU0104611.1 hypothetical protein [Paracholeplasma vituli]